MVEIMPRVVIMFKADSIILFLSFHIVCSVIRDDGGYRIWHFITVEISVAFSPCLLQVTNRDSGLSGGNRKYGFKVDATKTGFHEFKIGIGRVIDFTFWKPAFSALSVILNFQAFSVPEIGAEIPQMDITPVLYDIVA